MTTPNNNVPWQERDSERDIRPSEIRKDAVFTSEEAVTADKEDVARSDRDHMVLHDVDVAGPLDQDAGRAEYGEEQHTKPNYGTGG